MKQFLDAFTADCLPRPVRSAFGRDVVPSLVRACAAAGLRPMISTDLADFWSICRGDPGRAIMSQFVDPAVDPNAGPTDTAFVILMRNGAPVASAGVRLRWVPGTLGEAVVDGSLLYPHGAPKGFRSQCIASLANTISGTHVAVYTGYWRARSEDPLDARPMALTVRLLHAYALGAMAWSHGVAFAENGVARAYAHSVWLAEAFQPGVAWEMMGRRYTLNLVSTARDPLIDKLLDARACDPAAKLHLPAEDAARRAVA